MASSDYISRGAAEKVFSQPVTMSMCLTLEECKMKNAQRQIDLFVIRGLPAADVRPVRRGKWEPSEKYKGYVSCSVCHDCYVEQEWVTKLKWNFCPNCGARMEES